MALSTFSYRWAGHCNHLGPSSLATFVLSNELRPSALLHVEAESSELLDGVKVHVLRLLRRLRNHEVTVLPICRRNVCGKWLAVSDGEQTAATRKYKQELAQKICR
jgi:hypothetical protein